MHISKSNIFTSEKYQKCYFSKNNFWMDDFRFLTSEIQTLITSLVANKNIKCGFTFSYLERKE